MSCGCAGNVDASLGGVPTPSAGRVQAYFIVNPDTLVCLSHTDDSKTTCVRYNRTSVIEEYHGDNHDYYVKNGGVVRMMLVEPV